MITKKLILTEASKTKILIDKLYLQPDIAEEFNRICGALSIWMANKLIAYIKAIRAATGETEEKNSYTPQEMGIQLSRILKRSTYMQDLVGIMDYIRIGLNSNISSIKELPFDQIKINSETWHEDLHIGDDAIDYTEEHPFIRDYRNNGIGFYWVDLEKHYCDEESERMGHCGRTGGNTLFSLRQFKQLPNGHTLNSSHITAAIGSDGKILQMKGQKNSKPKIEYHKYILDLLLKNESITGFGYEYDSENDFKLSDLTEEQIHQLYAARPELFNSRSNKRLLIKLGIIQKEENDGIYTLKIAPDDIYRFVDGGWNVGQRKIANSGVRTIDLFEALLTDPWSMFNDQTDMVETALEYYINDANMGKIKQLLLGLASSEGHEIEPHEGIEDLIDEYDSDYEITNAINSAYNDAENDGYISHYLDVLKAALEMYGTVIKMDDEGVEITVNVDEMFKNFDVDETEGDDYFDRCSKSTDIECVILEMITDHDKPRFSVDDRWTPDIDEDSFNEILADRLSEIEPVNEPVNESVNKIITLINKIK